MNSQALKLELINWLTGLNDNNLLESIASIKDSTISGDWYDELTPEQKKSLDNGIKDHKKGKTLTSKEFWSRYEKKA
jgi:hypothetical protein